MHNFNSGRKEPLQFFAWFTGLICASFIFVLWISNVPNKKLPAAYSLENEAHASLKFEGSEHEVCAAPEKTNIEKFSAQIVTRDFHLEVFEVISATKKNNTVEKKFSVKDAKSKILGGYLLTGATLLAPSVNVVDGIPYAAEWHFEFTNTKHETTTLVMFSDESKQNEAMESLLVLGKSHAGKVDLKAALNVSDNHFFIPEIPTQCSNRLIFAKAIIPLSGAQVDRANLLMED